jgi:hypothetical protein
MKRRFLTYCLMCVVSLAAALVFYSCSIPGIPVDGVIEVSPWDGPVGTTFSVSYKGKDRDKIDRFHWELRDGITGFDYGDGSTFTAHKAGTLTVRAEGKTGYDGLSSRDIKVYKPDIPPHTVTTMEDKEVTSTGRLTITGLGSYHGWKIEGREKESSRILAYQSAFNTYYYYEDGSLASFSVGGSSSGTVSDGQVSLKLFIRVPNVPNNGGHFEGYTGNDQNVQFQVSIIIPTPPTHSADGTVTVNFTNGVGSGVFVPNP